MSIIPQILNFKSITYYSAYMAAFSNHFWKGVSYENKIITLNVSIRNIRIFCDNGNRT